METTHKAFGAGALHTVVAGWKPVTHRATLRMLERQGCIRIPAEHGKRGHSAIGPVTHRYVFEGDKGMFFEVNGRKFRLRWADGCFHPFLWELVGDVA